MNTSKVLLGGLAGGVALFFLGWIIYGMLLMDFMSANGNQCAMRPESDFVWWAMVVSCLSFGFFYALIFDWANIATVGAGLKAGAILGALCALGASLNGYAMTTMYSNLTAIILDLAAATVMTSLAGAVIAWAMGRTASTPPAST
jgi:hypothetical protein